MRIKLGFFADSLAKSCYVACEKEIHKWSRFVIQNARKIGCLACTFNSRLNFRHFCEHGLRNSLQFFLFLLKKLIFAKLLHFKCFNIGKTNTRYTDRAYLPVTIWVDLCGVLSRNNLRGFLKKLGSFPRAKS